MAKIKFEFDSKELNKNLRQFNDKLNRNVAAVMDYNAAYTTTWLKTNAPWTDRTSAARTGLITLPFNSGNQHELLMAYSVYYGIWLEIANSGRYAIITPGMRIVGAKVMADMRMLIEKMGAQ